MNTAVLRAGWEHLISDSTRFNGVTQIGVDEHKWRHKGFITDQFVTIIVDLTPRKGNTGPARLIDMIPGRSSEVLSTWLDREQNAFKRDIKVVAMDGFTGYKTAIKNSLPNAACVLDPFHVIALIGDKLTHTRQRLQLETTRRRGRKTDLLYQTRKALLSRPTLLSEKSWKKVLGVITNPAFTQLNQIWQIYHHNTIQAISPNP